MIQINLVPDVKLELIKAQRHRRTVMYVVVLASAIAGAVTVLLALYVFGYQNFDITQKGETIKTNDAKFQSLRDVEKTATITNQFAKINETHNDKPMTSRIFDFLAVASSKGTDNSISINTINLDTSQHTITVTAQTDIKGFEAADVFRKNVENLEVSYVPVDENGEYDKNGESDNFRLAQEVNMTDLSLGRDDKDARQKVSFKLSFTYDDRFFSPSIYVLKLKGLTDGNVTDSYTRLPKSLFGDGLTDEGAKQ